MKIKSIKSAKRLKNKTILVRCDLDVPLSQEIKKSRNQEIKFKVVDDTRLKACIPTIKYLLKKKVKKIILISKMGRPKGKVVPELSLLPAHKRLEKLLKKKIAFVKDFKIPDEQIVLLENIRFFNKEEKNDKKFAKKLASLGDIYVNEAFAMSHRSESSVDAIQNYLPSYAGLHLEKEIKKLSQVLEKPKKPLVVIIGGAKIETKLPVIKSFLGKADYILIGGAVANTFFKASGYDIGKSMVDDKYLNDATKALKHLSTETQLVLPVDYKMQGNKILDVGPKTIILFNGIIKKARTIIWNGPMGYFEDKKFAKGTHKIAEQILKNKKARVVIGGGETIQQLTIYNLQLTKNTFVSTGGGAMLEFLAGKKLPGLRRLIK